jgi:predicted DNA-binding protein with PD1-like motif
MTPSNSLSSNTRIHVTRLTPGTDLKKALQLLAVRNNWSAAVMVTCVGSLVDYNLRFANQKEGTHKKGHFEIVSLTGTLSASSVHLHLAASDEKGVIIGGHLLDGNIVFTTAEVAIAELSELAFERQFDPASGYQELHIVGR